MDSHEMAGLQTPLLHTIYEVQPTKSVNFNSLRLIFFFLSNWAVSDEPMTASNTDNNGGGETFDRASM